jgi:BirA family transcriptional regulator, biotin operon repressor / biotin---[acetyl-CoA-carboxylase] ligase
MTFGSPRFFYEKVGSTQDEARQMARAGAAPGTVVVAASMKAGRGRRGRAWHMPPGGNVALTAIGAPVAPETLWQLAFVSGVAAAVALERAAPEVNAKLRFPNDVQLEGRKLGGILIEAVLQGGRATPLIGIGLNVLPREWPEELQKKAICLAEAGSTVSVEALEAVLLEALTEEWDRWQSDGFSATLARWDARRDPDAIREFIHEGVPVRCRILSMDAAGVVTLQAEDGGALWSACAPEVVLGDD